MILTVLVAVAVAASVFATSLWGTGDGHSIVSIAYGLAVPLSSVFVVLGVIWLLLSQRPAGPETSGTFRYVACPSCGRDVLEDWRLCPYCGSLLDRPVAEGVEPPGAV